MVPELLTQVMDESVKDRKKSCGSCEVGWIYVKEVSQGRQIKAAEFIQN